VNLNRAAWRRPFNSRRVRSKTLRFERLEDRLLLATVSWITDSDGFWDVASNWSTGTEPGPNDDVMVDRPAGDFTISHRQGSNSIRSLTSTEAVTLSGGRLNVAATVQVSNTFTMAGGTLANATVLGASGTKLVLTGNGGTLDGVRVDGDLVLGSWATATIVNGLELNGTVTLAEQYSRLDFVGTQTLSGTGAVVFGNFYANAVRVNDAGTTLTIGSGITIRGGSNQGYGARLGYSDYWGGPTNIAVVNLGTISADGSRITLLQGSFTNAGTAEARNGGE